MAEFEQEHGSVAMGDSRATGVTLEMIQNVVEAELDDVISNSNGGAPSTEKQKQLDADKAEAWAVITAALSRPAQEPVAVAIVPPYCSGSALSFDPGVLHVSKDGSGYIAINEDDFVLEDDRCEGPDGPEGSVHWITRLDDSEIVALRDFLNGNAVAAPQPTHRTSATDPAPSDHVGAIEALRLVAAYDDLLRSHEGPSDTLFAGDVAEIDDAYDEMVAAVRAALKSEGSE